MLTSKENTTIPKEKPQEAGPEPKETSRTYKYIVAFVIIVALVIFFISAFVLLIRIVPDLYNLATSAFRSGTEDADTTPALSVSDTSVEHGDSVTVSFEPASDTAYTATFLCENEGVYAEYNDNFIECNESFALETNASSFELVLFSEKNRFADSSILVESEEETVGETAIVISNSEPTPAEDDGVVLGTGIDLISSTTTDSSQNGRASATQKTPSIRDAAVRIISVGVIENGFFAPMTSFPEDSRVAIQFEVVNTGNTSFGVWQFRAGLPSSNPEERVFNSPIQPILSPGSRIVYTLSFTNLQMTSASSVAIIQVDPFNMIAENNEANNIASANFETSGGFSSGSDEADFDVDLIGFGRMSGSRFIPTSNLDTSDEVAIRFRVTNRGGEETERWNFELRAETPDGSDDLDFESNQYSALESGENREITLTFDNLEEGEYEFEIEIDPDRNTDESTRRNNVLKFDVDIDN